MIVVALRTLRRGTFWGSENIYKRKNVKRRHDEAIPGDPWSVNEYRKPGLGHRKLR